MYVTELVKHGLAAAQKGDVKGALIRISPDGQRTEIAPGRLTAPGGVGVGSDGTVYVSNFSIFAGRGQVLAIRQ
jgi:sugar lactone lactonase YvrE